MDIELGDVQRSQVKFIFLTLENISISLFFYSNYFAMTQLQLAEQLVRQGLPLAGSNSVVKRDLQRLLSQIISVK